MGLYQLTLRNLQWYWKFYFVLLNLYRIFELWSESELNWSVTSLGFSGSRQWNHGGRVGKRSDGRRRLPSDRPSRRSCCRKRPWPRLETTDETRSKRLATARRHFSRVDCLGVPGVSSKYTTSTYIHLVQSETTTVSFTAEVVTITFNHPCTLYKSLTLFCTRFTRKIKRVCRLLSNDLLLIYSLHILLNNVGHATTGSHVCSILELVDVLPTFVEK